MEQSGRINYYKAACYCRLSQDDENDGTSVSIETQMKVLSDYCASKDFDIIDFYCDDGYTGTNFERPAFKRMLSDIENGKVNLVVVKDLSRFGREHIMVGYYTQKYFPENNIRFIAVADGTDISPNTLYRYDMMMPIKNIFNEFFPADTSMKVRQALETKAKHGEFIGSQAPYGYKKSPDDKHVLIVDEETAPIVKRIFEMAAYEGMGFQKISFKLYDDKILTPSALNDMRSGRVHKGDPYQWNLGSVKKIIENPVYIGTFVSGKRTKLSFKSNKVIKKDESEWIVNENMCEPIISRQLWEDAHLRIKERKVVQTDSIENVFSGLLKCADCGYSMRISNARNRKPYFACGNYKKHKRGQERCTGHFVMYDVVYRAVLSDINRVLRAFNLDEDEFQQNVLKRLNLDETDNKEAMAKEIASLECDAEVQKRKYKQLYEDKFNGLIHDDMFREMSAECNDKRIAIEERISFLKSKMTEHTDRTNGVDEFTELIARYKSLDKLDKETLNRLVEKITVKEERNGEGKRRITIKIYYKFLGDCTF